MKSTTHYGKYSNLAQNYKKVFLYGMFKDELSKDNFKNFVNSESFKKIKNIQIFDDEADEMSEDEQNQKPIVMISKKPQKLAQHQEDGPKIMMTTSIKRDEQQQTLTTHNKPIEVIQTIFNIIRVVKPNNEINSQPQQNPLKN